jgi:uncharacterized membrane protein
MSELPKELSSRPQDAVLPEETSVGEALPTREIGSEITETSAVLVVPIADPAPQSPAPPSEDAPLLFQSFTRPIDRPHERIPHMGHIGILMLLALGCLAVAALLARAAISYHFFGVTTLTEAANEIHYTLGTEAIFYLLTLCSSVLLFPLLWHRNFFAALQWHAERARKYAGYLIGAAGVCFVLAMFDGMLLPGPADAPIDRIFRTPGAAWILFAFGVTLAPFFEELTHAHCSRFSPASASASASSSSPPAAPATTTSTAAPPRSTPRAAASPGMPSLSCSKRTASMPKPSADSPWAPTPSSRMWPRPAPGARSPSPGAPLLHGFLVRKAEKAHGTGRRIEGFCREGARVVIVDDVCTTGASTINAIEAAREAGMTVAAVVCIVEREEANGRPAVEGAALARLSAVSSPPTRSAPNTFANMKKCVQRSR